RPSVVAPWICVAEARALRCPLPLGLGREALAVPSGERTRVGEADEGDGIVVAARREEALVVGRAIRGGARERKVLGSRDGRPSDREALQRHARDVLDRV